MRHYSNVLISVINNSKLDAYNGIDKGLVDLLHTVATNKFCVKVVSKIIKLHSTSLCSTTQLILS